MIKVGQQLWLKNGLVLKVAEMARYEGKISAAELVILASPAQLDYEEMMPAVTQNLTEILGYRPGRILVSCEDLSAEMPNYCLL